MIGRFVLGAGLGGLVGAGVLALVSVNMPMQAPREVPPLSDALPRDADVPATISAPPPVVPDGAAVVSGGEVAPEDLSAPEAETIPPDAPPEADAPAEIAPENAPAPAPDAVTAIEAEEGGAENGGSADAVLAPELPATVPMLPLDAPQARGGDAVPDLPVPPAAASGAVSGPQKPGSPAADLPPQIAEPTPAPPPLTAEEEALLAQIAEDGPDGLVPEPPTALAAPETPAPETAPPVAADKIGGSDFVVLPPGTALPGAAADAAGAGDLPVPLQPGGVEEAPRKTPEEIETDRLPRIGDAPLSENVAAPDAARPITRFARAFDNPMAKPLYAVVLIDTGAADLDRVALANLPFPVSFALDPQAAGAAEHAAIYRAAGQEVVMLTTGLPQGATAQDVEVGFGVMGEALPEAVAVMDLTTRRFQADRPLASLVVPVIAAQGRGLLTWNEGLNAADQVAQREDLPAAVIFRNLDGAGESGPVIRRYLDRAAFKAVQENKVVVVGQTQPDTVAALLEWTVEGRAATVALAPVTAVLAVE